jgi:hypothetical protein
MVKVAPDASPDATGFFRCADVRGKSDEEFADWFVHAVDRIEDAAPGRMPWRGELWSGAGDEHRYPESTQECLNKLHTANLLLQGQTEAFRMVMDADDIRYSNPVQDSTQGASSLGLESVSPSTAKKLWQKVRDQTLKGNDVWQQVMDSKWDGQRIRSALLDRCRDASFMLEFGPLGDLPLHLTILLNKGTLGCDMLEAVESSDEYWAQCEKLVEEYGQKNMPHLPPRHERDTTSLQEFILNIPYQHDLRWWFKEWERREQVCLWCL